MTNNEHPLAPSSGLNERTRVPGREAERLFDKHMQAPVQCRDTELEVRLCGTTDRDSIDSRTTPQIRKPRHASQLWIYSTDRGQPSQVRVTGGQDPRASTALKVAQDVPAPTPHTDHSDTQVGAVRRERHRKEELRVAESDAKGDSIVDVFTLIGAGRRDRAEAIAS